MNVEQAIRDYLPQVIHMSLATSKDNKPWICEVHFAYDDMLNLYFRSLLSRRHSKEIMDNSIVAGNIVTQHELNQKVRGIYFEGTAKLLQSTEEVNTAFECLSERLKVGEETLEEAASNDGHKFFKIAVDTFYVSDSRESSPSQKYELQWHGGKK
jgi:uncharacterized protein YhbP (UPF0306 family)